MDGEINAALRLLDRVPGEQDLPFRLKEIQVLVEEGFRYTYDEATQTIHWFSP